MAKKRNKEQEDFHWGEALEKLQQFQNPHGVLAMLAAGAAVPEWVRVELRQWRAGNRPPLPRQSAEDERLLAAVRAYHEAKKRPGEPRSEKIRRILADHPGVFVLTIENFLDGKGRAYGRLVSDWNRWERIYIDQFKQTKKK